MKQRGMTLIEIMILICVGAIIIGLALGYLNGDKSQFSYGVNGTMETRCVSGMKVLIGRSGQPAQLLDTRGNGIACEELK